MLSYYEYMIKNHINTNDSEGDLARYMYLIREMFPDVTEPSEENHKKIRMFFNEKFVPDGVMYGFENSWKEYARCRKRKSKESS